MNSNYGKSKNTSGFDFDLGLNSNNSRSLNDQKNKTSTITTSTPSYLKHNSTPSWQPNKPSWTHQPAPPTQSVLPGSLSGPTSMVGDITGRSWASSAPAKTVGSNIGIVGKNPNLFGDLVGPALGQNKSNSNVPLKNLTPAANNKGGFSMGSMADSLPKNGGWGSSGGYSSSGNVNLGSGKSANPGGPSMKYAGGSGLGGGMGNNKDPFGSLLDFSSKKPAMATGVNANNKGNIKKTNSVDDGFGDFQNATKPELFAKNNGSTSVNSSGGSFSKLDDFGFATTQNQPPVQSSGGNDFDVLFSSSSTSGAKGSEDVGGQQSSGISGWDTEFGGGNDTVGTTELEGLPPPPSGVTAAAAKNKGMDNYKQGQFPDAIKWLSWAVILFGKASDNNGINEVLSSRASCYKEVGEYKKAVADCAKMAQTSSNEVYDMSKDPKRKAKSLDPGWKYGFWPDLNNKDLIQCSLCNKQMHSGVRRLKQHLAGGFGDVQMCSKTTTAIIKEMQEYIRKNARKTSVPLDDDDDDVEELEPNNSSTAASNTVPSSGTSSKRKKAASFQFPLQPTKPTKAVSFMIRKTPEEVVEERHSKGPYQTTIENSSKSEEEKDRVRMHIANFFYENGISFNAANSRSYEIMIESVGQFGAGLKPPTFHDLRVPLLEKAKKETDKLRERHENAWKQYGCSLMSDGWSDRRGRHLINFLANSPEGTFFLGTVDASSQVQDANMLANLFEEQIKVIGIENVVQIVTDNGANFKAAGGILMRRFPTLYWTPCAAHCLDLMLEDIGKLKEFRPSITHGRGVTTFVYRHGRLLSAMREKTDGRDLVRSGTTRFATAFLTLQSLYKNKEALRILFGGEDWFHSKLSTTAAGGKVHDVVLSTKFWNNVEDCIRSSHPLLVALRIVDGDEKPAMAEITAAMDFAKSKIKVAFEKKPRLLKKVLNIIERRWESQMEVDLYGAALFLNPGKFFQIKDSDPAYSSRLRMKFNDVLEKMVLDTNVVEKISDQADQYENSRNSFGKQLSVRQRTTKNPLDWWGAFGGLTTELTMFAKRVLGLCCSSSGCERNWSTFEFIHTKRRNRLEHQRLNDLVYIQYNRKIATRFQKRREEGKNFDPLILEDFQWDNEWVNGQVIDPDEENLWQSVDRALGASEGMENRRNPRRLVGSTSQGGEEVDDEEIEEIEEDPIILNDDEDVDDDYGEKPPTPTRENDDHEMQDDYLELDDNI